MKRISFVLLFSLFFVLSACSGGNDAADSDVTQIEFWHTLEGDNGHTLEDLVDDFNEQSDDVEVEASFQDEVKDQMRTVGGTDSAPDVFMDGNVAYYSQTDYIAPVDDMMEEDSDFDESSLDESVLENSKVEDTLYAMPFNISNNLLFYNAELFEEAGLDPDDPPETFSEVEEAAAKLSSDDVDGFTMPISPSFIYDLHSVQDELVYNNENGREGEQPTETYLNEEEGKEIYNWINDMFEAGDYGNFGREWSDTQLAFSSGELGMYLDSSAVIGIWLEDLDFEFQTAPMPVPDGEDWAGVSQGGSYLYASSQSSDEEQEAAWEFIKFMASPESQSEWAAETGYVPVAPEAAEMDPLEEVYDEHEQFKTAYDSLRDTEPSNATAGPSLEETETEEDIADSIESLLQGTDPESVLKDVEEKINKRLQEDK